MTIAWPLSPSIGTQVVGPRGEIWSWDGSKWIGIGNAGGNFLPLAGGTMTGPMQILPATQDNQPVRLDQLQEQINIINYAPNPAFTSIERWKNDNGGNPNVGNFPFVTTSNAFVVDRWRIEFSGGSMSAGIPQLQGFPVPPEAAAISSSNILRIVVTAAATAGSYARLYTVHESYGWLPWDQNVSFYCWCATGTARVGVSNQLLGHSGAADTPVGISVPISTTPQYISFPIPARALPSGSMGGAYAKYMIWFSSATNLAGQSGGVGVQSNTFYLAALNNTDGLQQRPFIPIDDITNVQDCARYFEIIPRFGIGAGEANPWLCQLVRFRVLKAILPTMSASVLSSANLCTILVHAETMDSFTVEVEAVTPWVDQWAEFTARADAEP